MKAKPVLVTIICLSLSASYAAVFTGTISGQITAANDAVFQTYFQNTTPLAVGDVITGQYWYQSPSIDIQNDAESYGPGSPGCPGGISFAVDSKLTGALSFFYNGGPYWFIDVVNGHLQSFGWADQLQNYFAAIGTPGFSLSERDYFSDHIEQHSASGTLTFGDPMAVPEPSAFVAGTFALGLVGLRRVRHLRRCKRAD
jgi:hypothetical protein